MLFIHCPCCGVDAEETEFHPGGEAHIERKAGADATDAELGGYLFDRANPKGVHFERWRHQYGCGKWFHMARDTRTLEIYGVYPITDTEPPQAIQDHIAQRLAATGAPYRSTN